jgi:hypothetical protein
MLDVGTEKVFFDEMFRVGGWYVLPLTVTTPDSLVIDIHTWK